MTQETKDRILDAAEQLFGEQGVSGVSLRTITTAAEANLAAVNYHFGSKEGLIKAVLIRRIQPVNAERLAKLDALEAADATPELEPILDAFLRPAFDLSADPERGDFCAKLVGRVQAEAGPTFREVVHEQFQEIVARFTAAIARACPHLERHDLMWRFQFMVGAMAFTMTDSTDLFERSGGGCDPRSSEDATTQLVQFAATGFRAPVLANQENAS